MDRIGKGNEERDVWNSWQTRGRPEVKHKGASIENWSIRQNMHGWSLPKEGGETTETVVQGDQEEKTHGVSGGGRRPPRAAVETRRMRRQCFYRVNSRIVKSL